MTNPQNIPADTVPTKVYTRGRAVYVPHYVLKNMFVGPCGERYNEATLKTYATPGTAMLWPRGGVL